MRTPLSVILEFALKATPSQAPLAHELLIKTQHLIRQFHVVVFDQQCAEAMEHLLKRHKTHKRYADMMIAAMAQAGKHIIVTRNHKHFSTFLPNAQLTNWIDEKPT